MRAISSSRRLNLPEADQSALIAGALSTHPVSGLTHNFYRYPARFSPCFARAAIKALTTPGDTILDPYVGGGTSLVEALALGRNGIGIDISQLAEFVTMVKTTIMSHNEIATLEEWIEGLGQIIHARHSAPHFSDYAERGYYKHLNHPNRWRLRRAIEQALGSAIALRAPRLEAFARCAILRAAQWALDGRRTLPSMPEFKQKLAKLAGQMITGMNALRQTVESHLHAADIRIYNHCAAGIGNNNRLGMPIAPARLVVTSPPYPGIHVLYHRWQVDGRKETAAPFWIADKLDDAGSSYYTLGDRKDPELRTYFDRLRAATVSIVSLCDAKTTFVQTVAFSDPDWRLPRYLETMAEAGLEEASLPALADHGDGRLWRNVPNRRWYVGDKTPGRREAVLVHRLKR